MRRLIHAIALAMVFLVALSVSMTRSSALRAQAGIPCTCQLETGTSPALAPCLGTADFNMVNCSQVGQQCFIYGYASWEPDDPITCVVNNANGGVVRGIGGSIGGDSWFNPINSHTKSIPYGYLSTDCGDSNFGAEIAVVHYPFTKNPCACNTAGTPQVTAVAAVMYSCQSY